MRAHAGETTPIRRAGVLFGGRPVTLTPRELEVLASAAHGETVKRAAARLGCTPATISQHRKAIIGKLDVANITAAVGRAHELGLLGTRPDRGSLPLTADQRAAFHAKCSELDNLHQVERRTMKKKTLVEASRMFGREITSANDFTRAEAGTILDLLEQRLDAGEITETASPALAGALA